MTNAQFYWIFGLLSALVIINAMMLLSLNSACHLLGRISKTAENYPHPPWTEPVITRRSPVRGDA